MRRGPCEMSLPKQNTPRWRLLLGGALSCRPRRSKGGVGTGTEGNESGCIWQRQSVHKEKPRALHKRSIRTSTSIEEEVNATSRERARTRKHTISLLPSLKFPSKPLTPHSTHPITLPPSSIPPNASLAAALYNESLACPHNTTTSISTHHTGNGLGEPSSVHRAMATTRMAAVAAASSTGHCARS